MKKLVCSLLSAGCAAASCFATTYYFKVNGTDWADPGSYFTDSGRKTPAGTVPTSGDKVLVAAGSYPVSDAASFAVISNLDTVITSKGTAFTFTVAEGETCGLGCKIRSGNDWNSRLSTTLTKLGAGTLEFLSEANDSAICNCSFDIREGTLKMPQNTPSDQIGGYLSVSSNATIFLTAHPSGSSQSSFISITTEAVSLITNATARKAGHVLAASGTSAESFINGRVDGGIRIWTTGNISLGCTNNLMIGVPTPVNNNGNLYTQADGKCTGVISAKSLGMKGGSPSSLGTSEAMMIYSPNGGGFRYTGEGETSDRNFNQYSAHKTSEGQPVSSDQGFLDGGPNGGLNWTGLLQYYSDASSANMAPALCRTWFTGENVNECVWSGAANMLISKGTNYSCHITKAGTGTWRFAENHFRRMSGGISILDGTLKYESIAERGIVCSLGTSEICTADDSRAIDQQAFTDYAFTLGGLAGGNPVFEYVGSDPALCTTRPLVLAGAGGHVRASAGSLEFANISARDADSSPTLVLDGEGTENVVREVTDGAAGAKLNVEKSGDGTWAMKGNQTFSGRLKVGGGHLAITTQTSEFKNFTWYRFTTAQIGPDASPSSTYRFRQICLYDEDGKRINAGLRYVDEDETGPGKTRTLTAKTIGPGEVGFDPSAAGHKLMTDKTHYTELAACFVNVFSGDPGICWFSWIGSDGKVSAPSKNDPKTWIPVVMHLAEGSKPAKWFDIASWDNHDNYMPSRFRLEGSLDGKVWETVYDNIDAEKSAVEDLGTVPYNHWLSNGVSSSDKDRPGGTKFELSASGTYDRDYYRWFKLSIAKIANSGKNMKIRQISLFDEAGDRQNAGLKFVEEVCEMTKKMRIAAPEIGPGEVGFDRSVRGYYLKRNSDDDGLLNCPFDGTSSGSQGRCYFGWFDAGGSELAPNPTAPTSWIPIVMHLPDTARPVTHFDIQAFEQVAANGVTPVRFKMEGSLDGVHWDPLFSNVDGPDEDANTGYWNRWLSDHKDYATPRVLGESGYALSGIYPSAEPASEKLTNVESVEVAKGAKLSTNTPLTIDSLRIDAAGAGTFDGFAFAENGTIDFLNLPRGKALAIDMTFANCTGVENLANWTLLRDGNTGHFSITVRDGKVMIVPDGGVIIIR